MAINVLWNKQGGPGGGTRRLHHKAVRATIIPTLLLIISRYFWYDAFFGGEIGSTHVVKIVFSLGMISAVIGSL